MIVGEHVDRHHRRAAVDAHVLQLLAQVRAALVDLVGVLGQDRLGEGSARHDRVLAAVRLQSAHCCDQHGGVGSEARHAALDVEEPLGAHVGAESGLGDEVVAHVDADQVGDDRRVAGGDVAERPGVHQHGCVLERLHQVRLDRLTQDHRHRTGDLDVLSGDRVARLGVADDDAPEPPAKVLQIARQRERRHHLRRGGDVEAGLARHAVEA